MRWDVFCRVIDNHGDLGVCWRLACDLARRGDTVRLVVDDARALAWMAPSGAPGVTVQPWPDERDGDTGPLHDVGDVVVEAFGCDPPAAFVQAMAARARPPVWVNLEYLSAEAYVERSHTLPSPQRNGLTKWFFYPGFTPRTGGLLREPGLLARLDALDGQPWLAQQGWASRPGERVVSLFCYSQPRLATWLQMLASQPTLLLATPGFAAQQLQALQLPPAVRVHHLPWLNQPDYDQLLRACDLNLVRGEDSFVRAHWAGRPMVWHIYPQHDGAHAAKLDAWLDTHLAGAPPLLAQQVRALHHHWNGLADQPPSLPDGPAWCDWQRWRSAELARQDDLVTQLRRFVARPHTAHS